MGDSPHCMSWVASMALWHLQRSQPGNSPPPWPVLEGTGFQTRGGEAQGVPLAVPLRFRRFHKPLPVPWFDPRF